MDGFLSRPADRLAVLRAEVLDAAELSGWLGVEAIINCLYEPPP